LISLFEKHKKVKASLAFDYKGYPIQNVLAVDIIALVYKKKSFNVRQLINLFSTRKIDIAQEDKILFSIGNYNRADYYELLKYVRTNIKSALLDLSSIKRSRTISFKNIVIACRLVFFNNVELDFSSKVSLMTTMIYCFNVIDYLEKQNSSSIRSFCSFCSNLNDEAILDYYFQKQNIPTYTLQHGLYFVFDTPPIDAITYDNLIADKLLCWGQYTKDEFIKYGIDESRLVVAGYPKKISPLTVLINNNSKIRILVLFARALFDTNNLALISLLAKMPLDVEIDFKPHPSLSVDKYAILASEHGFNMAPSGTIQELLNTGCYDCSISYNSTAYYDSYINNCVSLRYKDKDADNAVDVLDDGFSTIEELLVKMQLVSKSKESQELWNNIEKRLNYILGYGVNKYACLQNTN
jgi:hypothetical protein